MANKLTRAQMVAKLERIVFDEKKQDRIEDLKQTSLADSLLMLADLDHEKEYQICRTIAQHLLGTVPEPDDIDLSDQ